MLEDLHCDATTNTCDVGWARFGGTSQSALSSDQQIRNTVEQKRGSSKTLFRASLSFNTNSYCFPAGLKTAVKRDSAEQRGSPQLWALESSTRNPTHMLSGQDHRLPFLDQNAPQTQIYHVNI